MRFIQICLFLVLYLGMGICTLIPGLTRITNHKRFTQFHAYHKFAPKRRLGFRMEHYNTSKTHETVKVWFHAVKFSVYSFLNVER